MTADVVKSVGPETRTVKPSGRVGFDSLPDQLVNKAISQGFFFNVLCVGETGIGKSTLIETLFNQKFDFTPSPHDLSDPQLKENTYELKEANVKLKLSVAETCGFGDQINKEDNIKPVINYIDGKFENYLQEELKMKRSMQSFNDTRVHACLYFIAPTGHSLKSIDLAAMKALQTKVNIVPVIAKSDTITKSELQQFKARILSEIHSNNINIYQAPTDDPTVSELNAKMNHLIPFAVVGSSETSVINGKSVRVRQYPWGSVQVENESHCDFMRLQGMLLNVNMEDLRERTHMVHYETYRRHRLLEMGYRDDETMTLQEMYEKRRDLQRKELQQKEEEMRQLFVQRVKDKEQVLKEAERELQVKFETMKRNHAEEKKKLEEKKRILEEEIAAFERRKLLAEQAKQSNTTMKKKK